MDGCGLDLQDPVPHPGRCHSSRLFRQEGYGIALVGKTELAFWIGIGLGIEINTPQEHIPVEIRYQGANVSGGIGPLGGRINFLTVFIYCFTPEGNFR